MPMDLVCEHPVMSQSTAIKQTPLTPIVGLCSYVVSTVSELLVRVSIPYMVTHTGSESSPPISKRREELIRRAPSHDRLKALAGRLPSCDEWLDDKYDQDF